MQYLDRLRGMFIDGTPPEYAQQDKERRERMAFHQRMRQTGYPAEVVSGGESYKPETEVELRALAEAKQLQDQYLARKELYRQTGDPSLLENAGGAGQPNVDPNPYRSDMATEPEFVRRMQSENPATLGNGDGTFSTHGMASARVGNMDIAYPTVVNINGKLVRLSDDEALTHAISTGEYKRFPTQQDADIYARGAWKSGLGPLYGGNK